MPPWKDPTERLWALIDRREDDECWPWKGHKNYLGYGKFLLDGKCVSAHRAVVLLVKGEPLTNDSRRQLTDSSRREVRHLCNRRDCCNPKHLEYSNHSQNMLDRVAAGYVISRGYKLTSADYAAILASSEPSAILAKQFGIDRGHVYKIWNGKVAAARGVSDRAERA